MIGERSIAVTICVIHRNMDVLGAVCLPFFLFLLFMCMKNEAYEPFDSILLMTDDRMLGSDV